MNDRGLFIAVGQNGLRMASENGVEWKGIQTGKEGEVYRALATGNGRVAAVGTYGGSNIYSATTDGNSWKSGTRDAKYVKYFRGLGFGNNQFVGLGGDPGSVGDSKPFVMLSSDGLDWSDILSTPGKHILRRVAWGNSRFVAVGDRGRRAMSLDGKEWKDAPGAKAIDTLVDVAFGKSIFVGVGLHGLRMTSEDGVEWSNKTRGEEGEHLNSIIWAQNQFVAVGAGATYFSPDGVAWTRQANENAPAAVAFGKGIYLGSNWKGKVMQSTDAVHWKQVYKSEHHIEALAFATLSS